MRSLNRTRIMRKSRGGARLLLAAISLAAVTGCATTKGIVVEDVNQPLNFVSAIVVKLSPGGVRKTSTNGREFHSNYFPTDGRYEIDATNRRERAYSHMIVLGDRRPYRVEVRVYVESRGKGTVYSKRGMDKLLTEDLAKKLRQELANRREERNLIDDFRAF